MTLPPEGFLIGITLQCSKEQFSAYFMPLAMAYQSGQSIIIPTDSSFLMGTLERCDSTSKNGELSILLSVKVSHRFMGLGVIGSGTFIPTLNLSSAIQPEILEQITPTGGSNNGKEEKHSEVEPCFWCEGDGYTITPGGQVSECPVCLGKRVI